MVIAKNVLVATDFSERGQAALEQGLVMPMRLDAKRNVVSAFPPREKRDGLWFGTNGRRGPGRRIMGSTPEVVLRDAGLLPLITNQPEQARRVRDDSRVEARS